MIINVHYTAQIKSSVGAADEQIEMSADGRLKDLVEKLTLKHGDDFSKYVLDEQGELLPAVVICMNDQQVALADNVLLTEGATIMFLTAISGG